MRDADFLLLDEATANLDSDSEKQVQKAINTLIHKQTTFVIAHRLSTIVDADQIIVLQNGRITGFGTHDELLSNHGYYQKLLNSNLKDNNSQIDASLIGKFKIYYSEEYDKFYETNE